MNVPQKLRYTKEHEWTQAEGDVVTIGVTAFAVDQLGDITLVECPEVGEHVAAGDTIGTIESVKAVSDLYSPVTGEVVEINGQLEDEPEKVNEDCYGDGWMLKVKLDDTAELDELLDAEAYRALLESLED